MSRDLRLAFVSRLCFVEALGIIVIIIYRRRTWRYIGRNGICFDFGLFIWFVFCTVGHSAMLPRSERKIVCFCVEFRAKRLMGLG